MAEIKTKRTEASVHDFLNALPGESLRNDCRELAALMEKVTKAKPKMWGPSIVGFGESKLKYADGSVRDWMKLSFSPRKTGISLCLPLFEGRAALEAGLGKYKSSRACVQIKKLADVNLPALTKLLKESAKQADCGCL